MKIKSIASILLMAGFLLTFFILVSFEQGDPWLVPAEYKTMKNPVKADQASIATGKTLYAQHCKSCHGKEGLGDGPKAAQLSTPSGDFTVEAFQSQSDGSLFYKIREGRDDMPSYKKKIPYKEDIWSIVNYVRTLE
jgi:mono/diheme cytochrome c family protein